MNSEVTVQVGLHTPLCRLYKSIKQERNGAIYMRSLLHSVTGQPSAELLHSESIEINKEIVLWRYIMVCFKKGGEE